MRKGNDVYADIVGNKERIKARYQDIYRRMQHNKTQTSSIRHFKAFVKIKQMKLASQTPNLSLNALHKIYNEIC